MTAEEMNELFKRRKDLEKEYIMQFDTLTVQENEYYLQEIKDIDKEIKKELRKRRHE